jgi:hypothetical protein
MTHRPTALERAFELARSGACANTTQLRDKLKAEGFSPEQLTGRTLMRQLRELCLASQTAADQSTAAE